MEQSAQFEQVTVRLPEPTLGVEEIRAVVGIPRWWPTGNRVAVAMAHDAGSSMDDPLLETLHRELAGHNFLTVRFNFPFAESGEPASKYSAEMLERAFRAALSILGRNPSAAPAHLFLGGKGIGAWMAARLATQRLQLDGIFCLGYPLHAPGQPDRLQADYLYRLISPTLFVQGALDRRCELPALQKCLGRVGAPSTVEVIEGLDHTLIDPMNPPVPPPPPELDEVAEMTEEPAEALNHPISIIVAKWMDGILGFA